MRDDAVKNLLGFIIEDLEAVRRTADTASESYERDALRTVTRALEAITADVREAAGLLETERTATP